MRNREKKKHPSFPNILSATIREFGCVFGVNSLSGKTSKFVDSVRRDIRASAVLDVNNRALVWMWEGGLRKLILWSSEFGQEEKGLFDEWIKMPATSMLQERRVIVTLAPYASSFKEVLWGADNAEGLDS